MKSKEQDGDADVSEVCEMSAHYKVKYGLEGLEQSISRATKRFSKNLDYNHPLACSLPNLISDSNGLTGSYGEEDDEMSYMVMHPLSPTASESVVRQSSLRSSSSARGRGDSQVSGNSSVGSQDQTSVSSRDETTGHSNPVTSSQTVYDEADHSGACVCVCVCVCVRACVCVVIWKCMHCLLVVWLMAEPCSCCVVEGPVEVVPQQHVHMLTHCTPLHEGKHLLQDISCSYYRPSPLGVLSPDPNSKLINWLFYIPW